MRFAFAARLLRLLASGWLAVWLLGLIGAAALVGTLVPQGAPDPVYVERYGAVWAGWLTRSGLTQLYGAWWFVLLLGLLAVNLVACLSSRWLFWCARRPSLIRHLGFLVVLVGGAVSALWAERGTIRLEVGQPAEAFRLADGSGRPLGFGLELEAFELERHDERSEQLFVRIPGDPREHAVPVAVNRLQPVGDTGYAVRIMRYVPDFAMAFGTGEVVSRSSDPNNPALQVQVRGPMGTGEQWVFANPAGWHTQDEAVRLTFHQRPTHVKSFRSRIAIHEEGRVVARRVLEVNHPLRYRGLTIYQQSYDPERWAWSGILVTRDPGAWVVYAGFVMIVLSLFVNLLPIAPLSQASMESPTGALPEAA